MTELRIEDADQIVQSLVRDPTSFWLLRNIAKSESGDKRLALDLKENLLELGSELHINFVAERNGQLSGGFSISNKVKDEAEDLKLLELIASKLEQVYELPYKPQIYLNGQPVSQYQ